MASVKRATGPRDGPAVRHVVERMAMVLHDYGFPRMAARVLMALTAADEPALTAIELSERLEVSPAAISGALRYLIQVGFIARHPVPGARSDHYGLPEDAWYEVSVTKQHILAQIATTAYDGVAALGPTTPGGRRLAEMADFMRFCQDEMNGIVARWRARDKRRRG